MIYVNILSQLPFYLYILFIYLEDLLWLILIDTYVFFIIISITYFIKSLNDSSNKKYLINSCISIKKNTI
jgi:hypothetical protein